MSRINTLLFDVPAVVLLLLPLLYFAVGHCLQAVSIAPCKRNQSSSSVTDFANARIIQTGQLNFRAYAVWEIHPAMTLHVDQ
jgi:hypothetical protein